MRGKSFSIDIDLDKPCAECGKKGATQNGLCMNCTADVICGKKMKSEIGKAVVERQEKRKGKP